MFTKNLFKPFFTFSLLALLLMPQVGGSGTAFAAGPSSEKDPPNPKCLDMTQTFTDAESVISVATPPGKGIQFNINYRVTNDCTANNPVSQVTITATLNATCPSPSMRCS
jgi:hypothetical protein